MNGETINPSCRHFVTRSTTARVVACEKQFFPVAIPVWKIAPALVAGNTVVFKPASLTPATAVRIVELFTEAGIPPGVLNLVLGSGSEAGDEIINHPAIKAVSFTGSNEVGIRLYEEVSRRGAKVQCEMGGKNPVVVLEDADLDLAVESLRRALWIVGNVAPTPPGLVINEVAENLSNALPSARARCESAMA